MSRRPRLESPPADPAAFHREFEVAAVEGGTEVRVRPTAVVTVGDERVRQTAALGGLFLLLAGLVGAVFFASHSHSGWAWPFPLALFGGLGVLCLLIAWVGGSRRDYVLTVSSTGEVRHHWRVVGPGEAVAVWAHCTTYNDIDDGTELQCAYLYIEQTGKRFTELPVPRFSRLSDSGLARALAAKLAELLKVPLREGEPPEQWSSPKREDASRRWWATVGMLVIGVPHFLFGFSFLVGVREAWWVGLIFMGTGSLLIAGACWQAGWGRRGFGLIVGGLMLVVFLLQWLLSGVEP